MNKSNEHYNEIINYYFYCKLKSNFLYKDIPYSEKSFYYLKKQLMKESNKIFQNYIKNDESTNTTIIKNYIYKENNFEISFPYIEIKNQNAYTPIFLSNKSNVSKEDKDFFSFKSNLLSNELNKDIDYYKIVLPNGSIKKLKIQPSINLNKLIVEIKNEMKISKQSHCNICEYKSICINELKKNDDIRLLGSMKEPEVKKWNDKGYFSITQLSYYYRTRRQSLITSAKGRYKFELKSLAIRENKTYVTDNFNLDKHDDEIFLDFESLPAEKFVYLIGILVVKKSKIEKKVSFWANNKSEEKDIFEKLFLYLIKFENSLIYHYGKFGLNGNFRGLNHYFIL